MTVSASTSTSNISVIITRPSAGKGIDGLKDDILKKVAEEVDQRKVGVSTYPYRPGANPVDSKVDLQIQFNPADFFGAGATKTTGQVYPPWVRPAQSAGYRAEIALKGAGHQEVLVKPGTDTSGKPVFKISFKINPTLIPAAPMSIIQHQELSEFDDV